MVHARLELGVGDVGVGQADHDDESTEFILEVDAFAQLTSDDA